MATLTKDEILLRLRRKKKDIQSRYPVKNIALFGSYARGEQTSESDIDLMVEFSEPVGWEIVDLLEEIEKIFRDAKVDLISKGGIKPRMLPYIEKDLMYV
jgi:predicted nucleotidyltransferase